MSFLKLIRYKNLLMVLLTMVLTKYALVHSFIIESFFSDFSFCILSLSVLLICAGGYIINDIFDIETDRINKPNKLLLEKSISIKNAWFYYYTITFFGVFLGLCLSFYKNQTNNILIFLGTGLGLFLYAKYLKKMILLGNLIVAVFIFLTILLVINFEYIILENHHALIKYMQFKPKEETSFKTIIYLYMLFSFITTFIREIIKDIEDINGDLKIKAKTLPILFGRKRAAKTAFFISCLLLFIVLIVLQYLQNNYLFLSYGIVFIFIPLLYFLYKLWIAKNKNDFSNLSSILKFIMLFGILSMLLFTVN